jgi:predicted adenine nucleotide alpha hydrolase (AANH) superfamily ATPase
MASISRKKILLHVCCASCLSYSYKILSAEGFEVIAFFYNPNIHGRSEYEKRRKDVESTCEKLGIEMITPPYSPQEFFDEILPYQTQKSLKYISDPARFKKKRCTLCQNLRLSMLVSEAKKRRLHYFSSTLLVSPFRNHPEIIDQAIDLSLNRNIKFFYRDFRKGYWEGRNYARANKLEVPGYCGCTFSIEERILE